MAKQWRNKSTTVSIYGFQEMFEALQQAEKDAVTETRKYAEQCAENLYDALYEQANKAGLDNRLLEQLDEKVVAEIKDKGIYHYEVGWKKSKPSTSNPLPDTYKVMFYNYGTPSGDRITNSGANRGQEPPHPKGSHGFIKKAKIAAANRNKKLHKDLLNKLLGDLK